MRLLSSLGSMSPSRFNPPSYPNPWRRAFHHRPPSNVNYNYYQGHHRHDYGDPRMYHPRQHYYYPRPLTFNQPPPPRPADHRSWVFSNHPPPPQCERFTVVSYNILADYLARNHRAELYSHIPHHVLDWEWRKRRLFWEFGLWSPDIMCLQEVDRFHDLEAALTMRGYAGIWKMRTGNAVDGCAIFWRTNRFQLRHEEYIEFNQLGLRDNIAQICVLESRVQIPAEYPSACSPASSGQSVGANQVVICNIHVLYNPKRGEMKLGQVRVLLDQAYAVSRLWNNAPVILCGDFNCTPKSPLYNFISEQKLSLSGLARDQVSGQYSASIYAPRPYFGPGLHRPPYTSDNSSEAKGVEQGNCYKGTGYHLKPQNDIKNASLAVKLPQRLTGMHQAGMLHGCSSGITSDDYRPVSASQRNDMCCNEQNETPVNIGNVGNQNYTAKVSFGNDACLGDQLEHGENSSAIPIDNHMQRSLSAYSLPQDRMLPQECMDSSAGESNTSESYMEKSVVPAMHKDLKDHYTSEDVEGSTETQSDILEAGNLLDEASLGIKPRDDFGTKHSSIDMVLGTSAAKVEVPTLENFSADFTTEQNVRPAMSCQNTCKNGMSYSSPHDGSLNEDGAIMTGDVDPDVGSVNTNSDEFLAHFEENFSLHDTEDSSRFTHLDSEGARQHFEKSDFIDGTHMGQSEDKSCAGQDGSMVNGLHDSEENSDPNFFKELLGTEDANEHRNELDPSTVELQESCSEYSGGAPGADMWKPTCNPYILTPTEIEIASGDTGCTFVEHNLKLRSAYTDVEDYAGTKDSSREPQVTSYNKKFMGTVDYIWYSEGLQTVKVLDTIPKHVLQRTPGFPTPKWGSDHLALACQLAFTKVQPTE